jgi:hypothetical protein
MRGKVQKYRITRRRSEVASVYERVDFGNSERTPTVGGCRPAPGQNRGKEWQNRGHESLAHGASAASKLNEDGDSTPIVSVDLQNEGVSSQSREQWTKNLPDFGSQKACPHQKSGSNSDSGP